MEDLFPLDESRSRGHLDHGLPLRGVAMKKTMTPIHPGEVLLEEFLVPLRVTQHRLAVSIDVPPRRINEIVHGKRGISADTALRLARFFGTSDRFWLNLQSRFDLEVERDHLGSVLDAITPLEVA
jgi:addiction module HigA family antidote